MLYANTSDGKRIRATPEAHGFCSNYERRLCRDVVRRTSITGHIEPI